MGDESRSVVRAMEPLERKDRVLIVEDEDNARKGYEQLLQRWGYEVVGVATAEEALAKFSSFQPDTLIADVELPGMNGLDLLKQLGDELHDFFFAVAEQGLFAARAGFGGFAESFHDLGGHAIVQPDFSGKYALNAFHQ